AAGHGDDATAGGSRNDTEFGGFGNDRIYGNLGQDVEYGGPGNDQMWALARGDVHPGPNGEVDQNGDSLDGGPGDDVIHTRDGEVDGVLCGPGNDTAILDKVDVIVEATPAYPNVSCEKLCRTAGT